MEAPPTWRSQPRSPDRACILQHDSPTEASRRRPSCRAYHPNSNSGRAAASCYRSGCSPRECPTWPATPSLIAACPSAYRRRCHVRIRASTTASTCRSLPPRSDCPGGTDDCVIQAARPVERRRHNRFRPMRPPWPSNVRHHSFLGGAARLRAIHWRRRGGRPRRRPPHRQGARIVDAVGVVRLCACAHVSPPPPRWPSATSPQSADDARASPLLRAKVELHDQQEFVGHVEELTVAVASRRAVGKRVPDV